MTNSAQLLILGNGFDRHCGLASDYNTFFKTAILDCSTAESALPKLRAECNGFWECLLFEYHKKYVYSRNYNWCNIERIIKDTLFAICFNEKTSQKNNLGYGIWWTALNCMKAVSDPIEKSKTILDSIEKYLFLYCAHFFFDVIKSDDKKSDFEMLKSLIEKLFQELRNFEKRFCNYLRSIIYPNGQLNKDYVINAINTLVRLTFYTTKKFVNLNDIIHKEVRLVSEHITPNLINQTYKEVNVLSNQLDNLSTTNILSFNYTNIFDVLETEHPCLVSNVHGKICINDVQMIVGFPM